MPAATPTDHRSLEIMSPYECDRHLENTPIGRVAFTSRGGPLILPVTYKYIDHKIVFRTSHGEKKAAADRGAPAGFEIDSWDDVSQTGWSVVIQGTIERVTDTELIDRYEHSDLEPWAPEPHTHVWVHVTPAYITGRRLR